MALKKLADFLGITEAEAKERLASAKLNGDEAASLAEVFGLHDDIDVPEDGRVSTDKIQTGLGKLSRYASVKPKPAPTKPEPKTKRKYTKRGDK